MFKNSTEIFAYIKKNDVKLIDVRFIDLPGIQHHFNVPVERINSTALATTPRGSREYGESSLGLCTENKITSVFSLRYGSRKADDGTGSNFISDS